MTGFSRDTCRKQRLTSSTGGGDMPTIQTAKITSNNRPTITGTGTPNTTFSINQALVGHSSTLLGTATVSASGTYSFTPSQALPDGTYIFSIPDTFIKVQIDTAAPTAPTLQSPASSMTNRILVQYTGEQFGTGTFFDNGAFLASFGGPSFNPDPEPVPILTGQVAVTLSTGSHLLTATSTDSAGNVSQRSASVAVTIYVPTLQAQVTTIAALPMLIGTGMPNTTIQFFDSLNGMLGTTTVSSLGTFSFTPGRALVPGEHSIYALDTDAVGSQVVATNTVAISIPAESAVAAGLQNDTGSLATDKITKDPTLVGTGAPNAVVHFILDGTPSAATTIANATGSWTFTPTGLADGTHNVLAIETNSYGTSSNALLTFTLDTTAPAEVARFVWTDFRVC